MFMGFRRKASLTYTVRGDRVDCCLRNQDFPVAWVSDELRTCRDRIEKRAKRNEAARAKEESDAVE